MKGFLVGFLVASLLWGAALALYLTGALEPEPSTVAVAPAGAADAGPDGAVLAPTKRQRRRARWRRQRRARQRQRQRRAQRQGLDPMTQTESGDELNADDPREVDLGGAGGEERLSSAQIDAAMGRAMPGIRRCLLLSPPDQPTRGRVVFGMRISGEGRVTAVRLSGPRALVSGEVGSCLRRTARAVSFPSFDGPEMLANYPITFE